MTRVKRQEKQIKKIIFPVFISGTAPANFWTPTCWKRGRANIDPAFGGVRQNQLHCLVRAFSGRFAQCPDENFSIPCWWFPTAMCWIASLQDAIFDFERTAG